MKIALPEMKSWLHPWLLPLQNNPTYLGITLDRSPTFQGHILKLKSSLISSCLDKSPRRPDLGMLI